MVTYFARRREETKDDSISNLAYESSSCLYDLFPDSSDDEEDALM